MEGPPPHKRQRWVVTIRRKLGSSVCQQLQPQIFGLNRQTLEPGWYDFFPNATTTTNDIHKTLSKAARYLPSPDNEDPSLMSASASSSYSHQYQAPPIVPHPLRHNCSVLPLSPGRLFRNYRLEKEINIGPDFNSPCEHQY